MKSVNLLNDPYANAISVIILTIISYILILSMNLYGGKNGALITLFYPSLVAMITIGVYFISRVYFKRYNWIISCAGIVFMFYISMLNWNLY